MISSLNGSEFLYCILNAQSESVIWPRHTHALSQWILFATDR